MPQRKTKIGLHTIGDVGAELGALYVEARMQDGVAQKIDAIINALPEAAKPEVGAFTMEVLLDFED